MHATGQRSGAPVHSLLCDVLHLVLQDDGHRCSQNSPASELQQPNRCRWYVQCGLAFAILVRKLLG